MRRNHGITKTYWIESPLFGAVKLLLGFVYVYLDVCIYDETGFPSLPNSYIIDDMLKYFSFFLHENGFVFFL